MRDRAVRMKALSSTTSTRIERGLSAPGSFSVDRADEGVHLVHVGIHFKSKASPVKLLQALALLRQHGESSLLEQVDLTVFDVAVVQSTHTAEQIADFDQRDQSGVIAGFRG